MGHCKVSRQPRRHVLEKSDYRQGLRILSEGDWRVKNSDKRRSRNGSNANAITSVCDCPLAGAIHRVEQFSLAIKDGDKRWELDDGATLHDVTHLPCRSGRYTPATSDSACSPAKALKTAFPVTPGGPMPPVAGCNKQDYAILFVIGVAVDTEALCLSGQPQPTVAKEGMEGCSGGGVSEMNSPSSLATICNPSLGKWIRVCYLPLRGVRPFTLLGWGCV
jgi:hypothetical protein